MPQRFIAPGTRDEVLSSIGLTAQDVARRITEWAADHLGEVRTATEDDEPAVSTVELKQGRRRLRRLKNQSNTA